MTHYLAQLHGSLLDPIWEFEFEMPNDKMAIDYMARHVTASFAHCPWFTYIWIRRMSDQKLIAEITLAPPQVKIDDQSIEGAVLDRSHHGESQ